MRYEAIENLLDDFDFVKVQKAMGALDWGWAFSDESPPSLGDLRRTARGLLEGVYEHTPCPQYIQGTGGFEAERFMETGDLNKYLSLKFVVTEANNHE